MLFKGKNHLKNKSPIYIRKWLYKTSPLALEYPNSANVKIETDMVKRELIGMMKERVLTQDCIKQSEILANSPQDC